MYICTCKHTELLLLRLPQHNPPGLDLHAARFQFPGPTAKTSHALAPGFPV